MEFDKISLSAVEEYDKKRNILIAYVDNSMLSRHDIYSLVGENGIEMMKINHMNHAAFMSVIFLLNRFTLLEDTLSWVYRAYHNHGFSYDYFPAELNAWMDAVKENLHPGNAAAIIEVYKRIISLHEKNIELSCMDQPYTYPVDEKWRETGNLFFESLMLADTYKCSEIAINSCISDKDIISFYLNVAQPSLYRIGDLWESGKITAAWEHLATAIVSRTLSQISFLYRPILTRCKRVMVLCITGEYHQMGASMVANSFELDGWNVNFLADSLPFNDTMQHITAYKPHLLAISVTMPYNIRSMIELIKRIKSRGYSEDMKILAGGQAFKPFPDLPKILGADGYASDCLNAVLIGDRLTDNSVYK